MNCPHCSLPIDPALVRAAANKDAGSRARPRAKGQAKRGCAHVPRWTPSGAAVCINCAKPVQFDSKRTRWRIRYPKQKSPAE